MTDVATGEVSPAGFGFGIPKSIDNFFSALIDIGFWRSMGWITLGLILTILGIVLWVSGSQTVRGAVSTAAKTAAL